jgi:hypothetical protein
MNVAPRTWGAGLALLLVCATADARVFWQFGRASGSSRGALESGDPNWSRAYAAPLRINGGRAEVEVWGTPQSVDETMATLRQRLAGRGGQVYFAAGGELAWGIGVVDGRVLRFLISAGPGRYSHVIQLVQDFADYRTSRTAPATAGLPDVPEMPEARVAQVLANEATGLTLATSRTAASPAAAQQQANALLAEAGWQLLMPAGIQSGFYVRGRDLLAVSAVSAGRDGETVLTLAHKRRAADGGP